MVLLAAIALGGLVGWQATLLTRTDEQVGTAGNVLVGALGALLAQLLLAPSGLGARPLAGFALAVGGAAALLAAARLLGLLRGRTGRR